MPQLKDERNRAGFSIIELLLVCAMLAILAELLLPLFFEARKVACRAQCASNLRQFAAAFMSYSQDWSGYWPCPGGKYGSIAYWAQTANGGLQGYLPQRGVKTVWCCPMVGDWNGKYSPRSYSMNSYLRTPADVEYNKGINDCTEIYKGVDICKLTNAQKTILLYEGRYIANDANSNLDYIYRCSNWLHVSGYRENIKSATASDHPWHGRYNNYLYCDGHVIARRPGLCTTGSLSTYLEMYEWYVDKGVYEVKYTTNWSKLVPRD